MKKHKETQPTKPLAILVGHNGPKKDAITKPLKELGFDVVKVDHHSADTVPAMLQGLPAEALREKSVLFVEGGLANNITNKILTALGKETATVVYQSDQRKDLNGHDSGSLILHNTGTVTSPAFTVEAAAINKSIAGGRDKFAERRNTAGTPDGGFTAEALRHESGGRQH